MRGVPPRLVCRAAGFGFGTIHHWGSNINTRSSIQNSVDTVDIQQNAWSNTSGNIAIVIVCFLRLISCQLYKDYDKHIKYITGDMDGTVIGLWKSCTGFRTLICWMDL